MALTSVTELGDEGCSSVDGDWSLAASFSVVASISSNTRCAPATALMMLLIWLDISDTGRVKFLMSVRKLTSVPTVSEKRTANTEEFRAMVAPRMAAST